MDELAESYLSAQQVNPVISKDEIDVIRDPLNFDLDDDTFLQFANKLKRDADNFWKESGPNGYALNTRQAKNEAYYFGRQNAGEKTKRYSSKAQDNLIWEAQAYRRAMALSQLPDITVKPGEDDDESKKIADTVSKIVTSDIQSRNRKRVLSLGFDHHDVYFFGVIKPFWNPQKGKYGDYDFKVVHPQNITMDFRAASNDVKDMDFVFETCEATVKELTMIFPDKKEKLFQELRKSSIFGKQGDPDAPNETNELGLNTKVKYIEVWFKWYEHPEEGAKAEKKKWEEVIGVAWYYRGVVLKKIKHPYWDWTGRPQTFSYDMPEIGGKRKQVDLSILKQSLSEQIPGLQTETVFHNHLDYPEFPYIFIGKDQWGKTPIDETTWIEQDMFMQLTYDKRNKQIDETIDRSKGKHVFSSSEGLTKDDIGNMDLSDFDQDILIDGDVTKVHNFIPGEQPSPALIQTTGELKERVFDKAGVNQPVRGQEPGDTPATNTQIAREGDYTRMDDFVDDTINYACEKMANWEMQFIKLFYTEFHMRRILGPDGKWLFAKLHRDLLDDGMEVIISASGSDKLKAEQRAMDMAKMKLIDPFKFFTDIRASDPRGRTISLMNFMMNPALYLQDVQNGGDGSGQQGLNASVQQVNGAAGQMQQGQGQGAQQAAQDIMQIEQGQVPPPPQQVDQTYLQTFMQFMQSPEPEQLIQQYGPQFQQQLMQFAQAVSQMAQQGQQQSQIQQPQPQPAMQGVHPGAAMGGTGPQTAGPLSQNPTPQNTSTIAAIAGR